MTNRRVAAFIIRSAMLRNFICNSLLALAVSLLPAVAQEQPDLRTLLRDGLYAEEVTRDSEAAAKSYEHVLARYSEQRAFAATALFRLAEVRRKQDRKDDAIQLYQRLLAEFPNAETEAKLARENLDTLGGKPVDSTALPIDEETQSLQRMEKLALASPDHLRKPSIMIEAVKKGWARPVAFMLDHAYSAESEALAMSTAAKFGHLSVLNLLLARGVDPKGEIAINALMTAVEEGNREIIIALLKAGTSPDGKQGDVIPKQITPLVIATRRGDVETAKLLIESGADVNLIPRECVPNLATETPVAIGGPLHEAVWKNMPRIVDLLLEHKADVNLTEPVSKITPVWLAARQGMTGNPDMVKQLLERGADPDVKSAPDASSLDAGKQPWPDYPGACEPLELAIMVGSVDCVKLLLVAKKARNTPVDSTLLRTSVSRFSDVSTALEITRLLLDHGADPNPPDLIFQSLIKLWNKGGRITKPKEKSLIQEAIEAGKIEKTEDLWSLIELLLERGSKINPDWVSEGFPGARADLRPLLIRRFLYPKWAGEKAIWIVDLDLARPHMKPAITAIQDEKPPMLEQWMLDEEETNIFSKDFPEFALYRKTEKGVTEIAVFRLNSPEPFPKLQWGDILEERGRQGRSYSIPSRWDQDVKDALIKRVKAQQPASAPGPANR